MLLHFKMSRKGRQNISPLRSLRSDEEFPFLIPPIALARGITNPRNYGTATVRERHDFLRRAFKTSFYLRAERKIDDGRVIDPNLYSSGQTRHFGSPPQNTNFKANWRIRGSLAWKIFPNRLLAGSGEKSESWLSIDWDIKLTLLKTLKNSARNCTEACSLILVFFRRPKSMLKSFGPRKLFFPELPNVPSALGTNLEISKNLSTNAP